MTAPAPPWSFVVRPLGPADAMVVVALHQATLTENWSAKSIVDIVALPTVGGHLAVAGPTAAPVPIGFILVMQAVEQAEMLSLGVLPAWRRRGVGHGLVAAAAATARARGASAFFLEVAADNAAALRLYEAHGFRPVGRRAGYYARANGAQQDAVVLQADLTPK